MARRTRVHLNTRGLRHLARAIRRDSPTIQRAYKRWAVIYLGEMQRRFNRFSRGGGSWPPLAQSTVRRRRKGGRKRGGNNTTALNQNRTGGGAAILRDTGTLMNALSPESSGSKRQMIRHGVRGGFAQARHPSGRTTLADIASFHQRGAGRLPQRKILLEQQELPKRVQQQFARELSRAVQAEIKQAARKVR
jgi:hypothetical protein